jgi:hypothetical protein
LSVSQVQRGGFMRCLILLHVQGRQITIVLYALQVQICFLMYPLFVLHLQISGITSCLHNRQFQNHKLIARKVKINHHSR